MDMEVTKVHVVTDKWPEVYNILSNKNFSRNWDFLEPGNANFARPYKIVALGWSSARNFRRLSGFRDPTATFGKTFAKVLPLPMLWCNLTLG